jgi:hypothetical protein
MQEVHNCEDNNDNDDNIQKYYGIKPVKDKSNWKSKLFLTLIIIWLVIGLIKLYYVNDLGGKIKQRFVLNESEKRCLNGCNYIGSDRLSGQCSDTVKDCVCGDDRDIVDPLKGHC